MQKQIWVTRVKIAIVNNNRQLVCSLCYNFHVVATDKIRCFVGTNNILNQYERWLLHSLIVL